ncbi:MAG: Small heat shock protein HSP16.5 [Methanocella sp. PtaU1.Bin125]|nr:MAG: Small heat shock protein HSP16.5 [Methanocella sp. PtaU1.Bin125]
MAQQESWDPFDELRRIQDRLGRIFSEYPISGREGRMMETPSVDVMERGNDVIVTADMPGINKEDIRLEVREGNVLDISAEKKMEKKEEEKGYVRHERSYTGYYRSIRLPSPVDKTKAKAIYNNGVLEVTLPMAEKPKAKVSEIPIS